MLKLKKKYESRTMSNGILGKFNTNDIKEGAESFYYDNGFSHIFNEVCNKCEKVKCICK